MIRKLSIKNQSGVTTIELVILLVIIAILAGFILSARTGVDQRQDNTTRQQDIDELRLELEAYYEQYNKYPTLAEVNNTGWRGAHMKDVNPNIFRDPDGTSSKLAAKPTKNIYAYDVTSASGAACNDVKVDCTQYTLTATLAGGGVYVKNNLN